MTSEPMALEPMALEPMALERMTVEPMSGAAPEKPLRKSPGPVRQPSRPPWPYVR
ncbi:hypothetical protein [Streptomyces atroolivaceus]|uniref:hypothetical protein n=1 Tax=Streptomyces atroolivaceus TaxID=66869 RepID=UPI002025582B|nr:hypothetical protein [Streptomyces atroolivaceus]